MLLLWKLMMLHVCLFLCLSWIVIYTLYQGHRFLFLNVINNFQFLLRINSLEHLLHLILLDSIRQLMEISIRLIGAHLTIWGVTFASHLLLFGLIPLKWNLLIPSRRILCGIRTCCKWTTFKARSISKGMDWACSTTNLGLVTDWGLLLKELLLNVFIKVLNSVGTDMDKVVLLDGLVLVLV